MIGKERRSMHFMNFIDFIGRFDSRFIFSFYSASVFYIVRRVWLDRLVKAFVQCPVEVTGSTIPVTGDE